MNALPRVTLRIFWISENNGELGNDAEAPYSRSERERVLGTQVFVHLLQVFVRSRFGAEKNHGATRAADGFEGSVRVFHHDVSTPLAPPSHIERGHPIRQFTSMIFAKKEIVVVKLNGIDAVGLGEMA